LFRETIERRNEAALLLGYANHAAKRLEVKMAKTPDTVIKFLDDLCSHTLQHVKKEVDELLAIKKADLSTSDIPFDGNIYSWDLAFYARILKEQKYNIDQLKVAEYFPLHKTISGMLRLFGHLFGLIFIEIKDEEDRRSVSPTGKTADIFWDESVVLYTVWDDDTQGTNNAFVGYLYLDLYPRPGKYGHACCSTLRTGFQNPDGTRCYPATCLIANLTKPTSSKPSLLRHKEVVTLFHELGHGMHDLVSRTTYSRFHGILVVRDFIEAPSQMLENWCWIPSCLRSFSSHYETGDFIPEDMIKSLIDAERNDDALGMLGQLDFGIFDMTIHTQPVHEKEINYSELFGSLFRKFTDIKGLEALGILS
jgi:metallopeptidase MepB